MTGHTKEPWSFVIDADWPFDLKLVCGGKTLFHQPRVAYSTKAKTLADVRSAVGFGSSERAEVVALIADQEALFERTADLWNALATIPDPQAFMEAARGMREALEQTLAWAEEERRWAATPDLGKWIDRCDQLEAALTKEQS